MATSSLLTLPVLSLAAVTIALSAVLLLTRVLLGPPKTNLLNPTGGLPEMWLDSEELGEVNDGDE